MSAKIDDRSTKTNKGFMTNQDKTIVPLILKTVKEAPNREITEENLINTLPEMGVNQFFRILGDLETQSKIIRPSPGLVGLAISDEEAEALLEAVKKQQQERKQAQSKQQQQPKQSEGQKGTATLRPPSLKK